MGNIQDAAKHLAQVRAESSDVNEKALIEYWEVELGAVGHPEYRARAFQGDRTRLETSKRYFLEGLEAKSSPEALKCFRKSIHENPYHHSARKMYLLMALMLARFDEVDSECRVACQLYPHDVDFRLLSATGAAASRNPSKAISTLEPLSISESEKKGWREFFAFLDKASRPVAKQDFFETNRLTWFADQLNEFTESYLQLFIQRRWLFPKHIGEKFARIAKGKQNGRSLRELRGEFRELVNVHPEGTLLAIAGETELAGVNPDDLQTLLSAREYFEQAVKTPAWLELAAESSWLGLYSTSMTLSVVHKHDKSTNQPLMLEATDNIDPSWLVYPGTVGGIVIPLFNMHEWTRVRPWIDRWVELAKSDADREKAYWHLAVWYRYQEDWLKVARTCDRVDSILPKGFTRRFNWSGLNRRAEKELRSIVNSMGSQ